MSRVTAPSVTLSPYERAINHLGRGDKFERALADELEKRCREDMAKERDSMPLSRVRELLAEQRERDLAALVAFAATLKRTEDKGVVWLARDAVVATPLVEVPRD